MQLGTSSVIVVAVIVIIGFVAIGLVLVMIAVKFSRNFVACTS